MALDGWETRQRPGADGRPITNFERAKAGEPGVVERIYTADAPAEVRNPRLTITLSPPGATRRSPTPAAGEATATTLTSSDGKFVLHPEAREEILRMATWGTSNDGAQRETGGPLLGVVMDGRTEILRAIQSTGERSTYSVELDLGARGGILDDADLRGEVHTHPNATTEPSDADLACWRAVYANRRPDGLMAWLSIIVGAPRFGTPTLVAYVTDAACTRPIDLN